MMWENPLPARRNRWPRRKGRVVAQGRYAEKVLEEKSRPSRSNDPTLPKGSERILGLTVNTLGRCIVWSLTQRHQQHGVLPGSYPVIAWLMHLEEATQTELSRLIGIEQPTMAVTLGRMERDCIIQRTPRSRPWPAQPGQADGPRPQAQRS